MIHYKEKGDRMRIHTRVMPEVSSAVERTPVSEKNQLPKSVESSGVQTALPVASNVEISEKARLMQQASRIAKETPEIDEAKVMRLRERISGGNYQVRGDALADKILEEHLRTDFGKNNL